MFPVVNVISFSPLELRFSPLLDHVTEMMCHLFKPVQFDFEEGNFKSGLGLNYCHPLLWLRKHQAVLLKLIDLDHQMLCKTL